MSMKPKPAILTASLAAAALAAVAAALL